jgi:RimJ/RimL family protein N-acetyltransferase
MKFEAIRATVDLAEVLGRVHSASWQAAYRGIIPLETIDAFTPEKQAGAFREAIVSRPEEYYLFKADGRPAGLASLHKAYAEGSAETEGEVYAIYFHPDYWGTSVTHTAFRFCLNRLEERGFTKIFIWVLEKNARARKFYEKYGFVLDGAAQSIDLGAPLTEVRYSKVCREDADSDSVWETGALSLK